MTAPAPTGAAEATETWEITTQGRVWLQVTINSRHGRGTELKDVALGPNRPGQKLKISPADREMNQEACSGPSYDPFRNGLLVRVDADQNEDEATASMNALTAQQTLDIFELSGAEFEAALGSLDQLPLQRLLDMAPAVDASISQVAAIDAALRDRYDNRRSQPDAVFGLDGLLHPTGSDGARGSGA